MIKVSCYSLSEGAELTDASLFFPAETMTFVRMPRISAQAMEVRVTLPKLTVRPPIPQMRMTATTKRFLLSPRSTSCIIFRPETAMKP